ncbi:MAG: hypothetical protein JWL88_102 [Parcubacteria group bacterium]|nr:hypothetical protein [Parcubacteria group bacterium]
MKYLPLLLLVLATSVPFAASASTTPQPYCAVLTKTADGEFWPMINNKLYLIAKAGEPVTIIWGSANAASAHDGQGTPVGFTGQQVVIPTTTTAYSYTFVGTTSVTCTVTAVVLTGQGSTGTTSAPSTTTTVTPPPVVTGTTVNGSTQSSATFSASEIPLLTGGYAAPGALVPVQYLKLVNTSNSTTILPGVWIEQDGTAPVSSVIGFTTVDDKAIYRTSTDMIEGATPFKNALAYVPLNSVFAPDQLRIFTIKAQVSKNISAALGTTLKLNVSSIGTTGAVSGTLPVIGTTWVLRAY